MTFGLHEGHIANRGEAAKKVDKRVATKIFFIRSSPFNKNMKNIGTI
jgi:hypothetical protein